MTLLNWLRRFANIQEEIDTSRSIAITGKQRNHNVQPLQYSNIIISQITITVRYPSSTSRRNLSGHYEYLLHISLFPFVEP
jgi:hypothetical protein